MQTIGTLQIPATPMISETSMTCRPIGSHASTMTLYADGPSYFIEWDIPSLDETIQIGLDFEHKTLVDYDGTFSLPREAVVLLRRHDFIVPRDFTT